MAMGRNNQKRNNGDGDGRKRYVYRIVKFWQMSPPDSYLPQGQHPTPLAYVTTPINSYSRKCEATGKRMQVFFRYEIDAERRAILKDGGPRLYGIYRLLCEFAGDTRHFMRGYLVDQWGQPAPPKLIAETIGLDPKDVAWAIRRLECPSLRLLEKCDWYDACRHQESIAATQAALRASKGHSDSKDQRQGNSNGSESDSTAARQPETPPDRTDATDATNDIHKPLGREGPPGHGGDPPGENRGRVAIAGNGNNNNNLNSNSNGNHSASAEKTMTTGQEKRSEKKQMTNDSQQGTGNREQGQGQEKDNSNGNGGRQGQTVTATTNGSQPPSDGGGEGTAPTSHTTPSAGVNPSGGMPAGQPAGQEENRPPSDGGGEGADSAPRPPSAMPAVLAGESGHNFAMDVITRLNMQLKSRRPVMRNIGAFASQWRKTLRMMRWLCRNVPAGTNTTMAIWLGAFGKKRLSKATHLAKSHTDPLDRVRIWMADFKKQRHAMGKQYAKEMFLKSGTTEIDC